MKDKIIYTSVSVKCCHNKKAPKTLTHKTHVYSFDNWMLFKDGRGGPPCLVIKWWRPNVINVISFKMLKTVTQIIMAYWISNWALLSQGEACEVWWWAIWCQRRCHGNGMLKIISLSSSVPVTTCEWQIIDKTGPSGGSDHDTGDQWRVWCEGEV
jgi:hypothetical protein